MKLSWIIFIGVLCLLSGYGIWHKRHIRDEAVASGKPQSYSATSVNGGRAAGTGQDWFFGNKSASFPLNSEVLHRQVLADSITAYGLSLIGAPYLPAGTTCDGFDCSGFIHHIFGRYGVELPHASALLIKEGKEVPLTEVKKGDLLIFTGPGSFDGTAGHVGVVITKQGQSPEFVHSSSVGGVKISKVKGTGYQKRFLQARRVL